jgi:hypothetical protein
MSRTQPQKSIQEKRKRLVGASGACITSRDAVNFLEADSEAKKRKLNEQAEKKRQREEKKKEDERLKEWKAVQKQNKSRKVCGCSKIMVDDKKYKSNWLSCYRCCSWCCSTCLPSEFKKSTKSVYVCESCSTED